MNIVKKLSNPLENRTCCLVLYALFIATYLISYQTISYSIRFFGIAIIGVVIFKKHKEELKKKGIGENQEIFRISVEAADGVFLYFIALILIYSVYKILLGDDFLMGHQEKISQMLKDNPSVLLRLYVGILVPIIEEIVFRYLPYKFFNDKRVYIVVSGLIFAILHCVDNVSELKYIPFYLPMAFYLGYRYWKTEDIFVTMAIHSFINLISFFPWQT